MVFSHYCRYIFVYLSLIISRMLYTFIETERTCYSFVQKYRIPLTRFDNHVLHFPWKSEIQTEMFSALVKKQPSSAVGLTVCRVVSFTRHAIRVFYYTSSPELPDHVMFPKRRKSIHILFNIN